MRIMLYDRKKDSEKDACFKWQLVYKAIRFHTKATCLQQTWNYCEAIFQNMYGHVLESRLKVWVLDHKGEKNPAYLSINGYEATSNTSFMDVIGMDILV